MSAGWKHQAVWAACALCARTALADDTDDIRSILNENVITTASTSAQKASTAPATSITVTAEDLRLYGIRSLDEAINFLSVGVITSNPLRTPDVGARGVLLPNDQGKHFLLLVNGHALNDPLYGAARFDEGLGVPFDIIDRIEVIVGPGSVLYGSNAMLGVINVITKNASDYRGGHVLGDYEIGRSERVGAGSGFTFKALGQPGEVTAGVEYFRRFGPDLQLADQPVQRNLGDGNLVRFRRDGSRPGIWGGTVHDAYFAEAPSGMLRVRLGEFEVNLIASAYRRGIPYTYGAVNVDFDDPDSYELDRAVRLDVKHDAALSSLVQLTSRLYADAYDYQRGVNRVAQYGCYQSFFATCTYYDVGVARWAGVEERLSLNWSGDSSFVTMLGVDARMRWVRAKQDAIDFDTGQPFAPTAGQIDDSAGIVSPYIQQTWSPTTFLDLNGGVRVDADQRFSPIVSPRGAIAVTPFKKTTLRAIYSQAFRGPTWIETDAANYQQARAQGVDPEVVRSAEASIEERFATQRIMFGVFRTWWDNLVEPRTLSPAERAQLQNAGELPITSNSIVQYRNISSLTNYGWNGGWDGSLVEGRFGYGVNATSAFTMRQDATGKEQPLPVAPQFFGNVHVSYSFGGYVPTPALAAYYVGARPIDRAFDGTYASPPYATPLAEIRGTLTGPLPGLQGLAYSASAAYATAAQGPYAVGPSPTTTQSFVPGTVPIDRFRVFFAIRYDFLTENSAQTGGQSR